MKIKINVKGVSQKKNRIRTLEFEYPDGEYTLRRFLSETVRITLEKYTEEAAGNLFSFLTEEEINDRVAEGKVTFGIHYNENKPDPKKAVEAALSAVEDGIVAVFLGETRVEELDAVIPLSEETPVTFVKLTFLAGRMW